MMLNMLLLSGLFCCLQLSLANNNTNRTLADEYCRSGVCYLMGRAKNCSIFKLRQEYDVHAIHVPVLLKNLSTGTSDGNGTEVDESRLSLKYSERLVRIHNHHLSVDLEDCNPRMSGGITDIGYGYGYTDSDLQNCSTVHQNIHVGGPSQTPVLEYFMLTINEENLGGFMKKMHSEEQEIELYRVELAEWPTTTCGRAKLLFDVMKNCQTKINMYKWELNVCSEPNVMIPTTPSPSGTTKLWTWRTTTEVPIPTLPPPLPETCSNSAEKCPKFCVQPQTFSYGCRNGEQPTRVEVQYVINYHPQTMGPWARCKSLNGWFDTVWNRETGKYQIPRVCGYWPSDTCHVKYCEKRFLPSLVLADIRSMCGQGVHCRLRIPWSKNQVIFPDVTFHYDRFPGNTTLKCRTLSRPQEEDVDCTPHW